MSQRVSLLLILVVLAACGSSTSQPVPVAVPARPTAPIIPPFTSTVEEDRASLVPKEPLVVPTPSTPLQASCAVVQKKHEDMIIAAEKGDAPLDESNRKELRKVGSCLPAGKGAWAVRLGTLMSVPMPVEPSGGSTIFMNFGVGALEAVFIDENGVAPDLAMGHWLSIGSFGNLSFDRQILFDFDGDGIAELALCLSAGGGNLDDEYQWECKVLAWKNGRIQPYDGIPAGALLRDIEDVDTDGRPDLLSMGPFEAPCEIPKKNTLCVEPRIVGPSGFLYHALPDGKFTPTDEAAKAYARQNFPYDMNALFESTVPPEGSSVRMLRSMGANAVRGALAFGEDRKKIRAALTVLRRGYCGNPNKCRYFDAMEKWPSSPFWPAIKANP